LLYVENDCQRAESVHGTGSNPRIRRKDLRRYVAQCIEAEKQKEAEREKATIAAENTNKVKLE